MIKARSPLFAFISFFGLLKKREEKERDFLLLPFQFLIKAFGRCSGTNGSTNVYMARDLRVLSISAFSLISPSPSATGDRERANLEKREGKTGMQCIGESRPRPSPPFACLHFFFLLLLLPFPFSLLFVNVSPANSAIPFHPFIHSFARSFSLLP